MLGTLFQINHFLKRSASCVSNIHLRHRGRQNCEQPRYNRFLVEELLSHCVCSDLLAHSLFILSYVETSLLEKVDLGVESMWMIKPSILCLSLKAVRILACVISKVYLSIMCRM